MQPAASKPASTPPSKHVIGRESTPASRADLEVDDELEDVGPSVELEVVVLVGCVALDWLVRLLDAEPSATAPSCPCPPASVPPDREELEQPGAMDERPRRQHAALQVSAPVTRMSALL